MANTTNFGWETPDDTDLVKDGAAAIRTLAGAIDTSLVDLKGGTTDQVLAKNSNTDMDFKWVADASGIPATIFDAKGDLIVATAADTAARLAVGTNGDTLVADSGEATGLRWAAPSSGALTLVKRSSFSNVANTGTTFDDVFTSTYKAYQIVFENVTAATTSDDFHMQLRYGTSTETGGYYNAAVRLPNNSATWTNVGGADVAFIFLGQNTSSYGIMNVFQIGSGSSQPRLIGNMGETLSGGAQLTIATSATTERSYTGFLLKSSSTNITGTVAVYGLAIA